MGFFAGLAQGFKPVEIANLAVGLLEERRKEEEKRREEQKKIEEERKRAQELLSSTEELLKEQFKVLEQPPAGSGVKPLDFNTISEIFKKAYENQYINPQTASAISNVAMTLSQNMIKEYANRLEDLEKHNRKVITTTFDANGYLFAIIQDKDGSVTAERIVDVDGRKIRAPQKEDKGEESQQKRFNNYIGTANQIPTSRSYTGDVYSQFLGNLISNSYKFFQEFPAYSKYLTDANVDSFVNYVKSSGGNKKVIKLKDLDNYVSQIKDLTSRGVITYAIINRLLGEGYSIGDIEFPTKKLE